MRATKVLMTADTVGGVWIYALDLARVLAAQGGEIHLASMGGFVSAGEARAVAHVRGLQLHESRYKLEWMEEPWEDVAQAGEWLLAIAHKTQPDIVHLNNYVHGALPWHRPVLVVGHSCVLSWWRAVRGESAPSEWEHYAAAVRKGLQAADFVVAPTQAMLKTLHHDYGPLPPSQVIHNGRSPRLFQPAPKEPLILAVGRLWDEAKNVQILDQIAAEVAWPIYAAGQEQHPDGGRPSFARVRPLGKLEPAQLARWLGRAAIYALPARYEPFGLSVLEAALSGCALVLGDIDSLREVWGDAALYVAPDDAEALAAALHRLIADSRLRTQLAETAYRRAQQYTLSAMGAAYAQAYQALLEPALPANRTAPQRQPAPALWGQTASYQPSTQWGR